MSFDIEGFHYNGDEYSVSCRDIIELSILLDSLFTQRNNFDGVNIDTLIITTNEEY